MSENAQSWIIMFVLLGVGFAAGWLVFDPDEEPEPPAAERLAAQCYREFDGYVREQVEWLRRHNDELKNVIELDTHNNEVKDGAVEDKF